MATLTASSDPETSTQPPRPKKSRTRDLLTSRAAIAAYIFVLPYILFFFVFRILPSLYGIILSFGEFSLSGSFELTGLNNYARLFSDPLFWTSLRVTGLYALIAIPLGLVIAIVMAQLCNRLLRGMSLYRSIFFLPMVTSPVLSGIVFIWIFSADGPINSGLSLFGIEIGSWLQSHTLVLPALAIVAVWMSFGYNMLILLAGMLAIPEEYYEAARMDGATAWQRFRRITLPLLKPSLFFVMVLETVRSFQAFDTIYVMTSGGPVRSSYTLTFMVYDQGFGYFDFGYASAAGVVLLVITLTFSLIQRRLVGGSN